jgi:uncharacterized protein (TIRG00374 family)
MENTNSFLLLPANNGLEKAPYVRRIRRFAPYCLILGFAAWCALSLRNDLRHIPVASLMRSWDLFLLAALLSLLNYVLRIVRWRAYLTQLGHPLPRRFAALTYIAGFAYTLSPGKVGEMARARYYLPLRVPLSDVAAAFFTERLLDTVCVVVLASLLLTAWASYQGPVIAVTAIALLALASFVVLPWSAIAHSLNKWGRLPHILQRGLQGLVATLSSVRPLLRPRPLIMGVTLGLAAWALEGLGLDLLGSMVPAVHLGAMKAIGIYGVALLIGALSFLPGGLGSTEAVMTTLLAANGYAIAEAVLVTLACRLVTLWFAVCLGWLAVLVLRQRQVAMALPWQ